ncbi:MAG: HPr family phosphocarrier protein [Candidatus Cloacimonetes bacterium]|nr:HPr family phosphocarrier protein [Candidatus Cloacimonadota bacterium]
MIEHRITITNDHGLHARPCTMIVKAAIKYRSDFQIILESEDMYINGKSVLSMLQLAAPKGTELVLKADGVDEEYLMEEIVRMFEENFEKEKLQA